MSGVVIAETIRRHVTNVGFVVAVVLIALIGMFAASFHTPGSMWPSLVGLVAIITGAALIGPEFSTSTLQLIVAKPIRRSVYLISRIAGVFASIALAGVVGVIAEGGTRLLLRQETVPWIRLGTTLGCELTGALQTIALLVFLGSITRSYFNVAIYIGLEATLSVTQAMLGMLHMRGALAAFLQRYPQIERGVMMVDDVLYPAMPQQVSGGWFARVALVAIIAIVLACLAFERREIPYGMD